MKKTLVISIALVFMCSLAQAALWNGAWSGANYVGVTDAPGDTTNTNAIATARDILALDSIYGTDASGTGYYFRMTLDGDPTTDGYAQSYMLNFDTDNNPGTGASYLNSTYVASPLTGIDMIVDTHYFIDLQTVNHLHDYNGTTANTLFTNGSSFGTAGEAYLATGKVLEWFVPDSLLGEGTTVYASTLNVGSFLPETVTYDTTSGITISGASVVPEPTSIALLALGVAALGLRRKFRK